MLRIAVYFLQTVAWAVWATRVRHPGRLQLYTFLLLINAATALEVLHHSCGIYDRSPTVSPHLPFL